MRKITQLLAVALVIATAVPVQARFKPELYASIVIKADTGEILHERGPDARRHPASLTKMMTLYLAFEAIEHGLLRLDSDVVVSEHAASREPSRLGLRKGSTIKVEEAILGMVTKSANDAASVLAEALAGSEANFGAVMTLKAHELGMKNTSFRNASGLPHSEQISTARDVAVLAQALIRDFPDYYRYFSVDHFEFRGVSYANQNRLLRTYPGADGIKTGYTRAAGHNLAASAKQGDHRLIAIVFGGPTLAWSRQHISDLLDDGFARMDENGQVYAAVKSEEQAAEPESEPQLETAVEPQPTKRATAARAAGPRSRTITRRQDTPVTSKAVQAPPARVAATRPARRPSVPLTQGSTTPRRLTRIEVVPGTAPATQTTTPPATTEASRRPAETTPQSEQASAPAIVRPAAPKKKEGWSVQIGIYSNVANAQMQVQQALSRLPAKLHAMKTEFSPYGEGSYVRASLVGLKEQTARGACGELQSKRVPCIVVPPGRDVFVAKR